jgi:hypothetical protein
LVLLDSACNRATPGISCPSKPALFPRRSILFLARRSGDFQNHTILSSP